MWPLLSIFSADENRQDEFSSAESFFFERQAETTFMRLVIWLADGCKRVLQNLIFGDNFVGMHHGASAYISEN